MAKAAFHLTGSDLRHLVATLIFTTLAIIGPRVQAQTIAPDAEITLPKPTIVSPTAVPLKGVSVQTQPVTLKRTFLEDFSNFQVVAYDPSPIGWKTHFPNTNNTHWMGRNLYGNNEQQIYVDSRFPGSTGKPLGLNPFMVSKKVLTITAARIPAALKDSLTFPVEGAAPKTFQNTSGLLTTYNTFSQTYGYFEFRANLPRTASAWSGMWMLPTSLKWPPEIDVMEVNNQQPLRMENEGLNATHAGTGTNLVSQKCYLKIDPGVHTYGVLWTPETMTYYEDRQPTCTFKTPDQLNEPMYLLLQLAIGPNVTAATPNQIQMQVYWVAAYKQ